jgi:hypothetical protein
MYKTAGKLVHLGTPVDLAGPIIARKRSKTKRKEKAPENIFGQPYIASRKISRKQHERLMKEARKAQKKAAEAEARARLISQSPDGPRASDKSFLRMDGRTKRKK